MREKLKAECTRRDFLSTSILATSFFASGKFFGAPAILQNLNKPNSLIKGVQIGVITYSFRDMTDQSAESTLKYIVDSGISAVELMGDPAEIFAGKSKSPVDFRSFFPLMRKRREKLPLTEEETKKLEDMEAQVKSYNLEVSKWRQNAPMNKFEQLGKMYKDAGVKIYAFKPNAFEKTNSDSDISYGMRAAKALGANQVTLEHPSDDAHTLRLGKLAEVHGVKVGYHGHEQQTPKFWDTALAQSSGNALNLDLGHFVAAGNINPIDFVKSKHQDIVSMHLKDRQTPANGKGNVVWGTGDTPIIEVLKLMRDNKYKFPATVEFEYKIPEGSSSVAEVQKCLDYCRKALS